MNKQEEFVVWLKGFMEACGDNMTPQQMERVKEKLQETFEKVTKEVVTLSPMPPVVISPQIIPPYVYPTITQPQLPDPWPYTYPKITWDGSSTSMLDTTTRYCSS